MSSLLRLSPLLALLGAAACTTIPTGPSVMALPGSGRNFDQFRANDADCRQFALVQSGGATANETALDSGVKKRRRRRRDRRLAGAAMGGHQGRRRGSGSGSIGRQRRRRRCEPGLGLWFAKPLRQRLHSMHVCQG